MFHPFTRMCRQDILLRRVMECVTTRCQFFQQKSFQIPSNALGIFRRPCVLMEKAKMAVYIKIWEFVPNFKVVVIAGRSVHCHNWAVPTTYSNANHLKAQDTHAMRFFPIRKPLVFMYRMSDCYLQVQEKICQKHCKPKLKMNLRNNFCISVLIIQISQNIWFDGIIVP